MRYAVLILLVIVLALFAIAPSLLKLGPSGTELWYVVAWITVSLVAGLIALRVAAKCDGSARNAWRSFGLACLVWMAGTVTRAAYGWVGAVLPFPSLADAFYLASNVLVMVGMFHYSLAGSPGSRIQVTNFALAICSTLAVGLILYAPVLSGSGIGWLGEAIVFSYPALGFSALVFGLLCFAFYVQNDRRFPFLLVLVATGANAFANFFYGFDILNETYAAGTFYDVLWIAGFTFFAWAALEHGMSRQSADSPAECTDTVPRRGEAFIPALAIAAILAAGVAARWPHLHPEVVLILPIMFGFAALLALREYALIGTERKLRQEAEESARQLAQSEDRLSTVLANTADGVVVLDAHWRVIFANQNASRMAADFRVGVSLWDLFPQLVGTDVQQKYVRAMDQQTPVDFEFHFRNAWFEVHAYPSPDQLSIFFRDVTQRRRLNDELVHLTRHDPLTGLANRTLFAERLSSGLDCGRRRRELTLVLIDLNDFKIVNDLWGHQVGDCMLQQIANRLADLVREGDTVARLGGDEFAIIQPGPAEPDRGAGIARRISEALLAPFDIQRQQFTVGTSIGIAMAPEHGSRPEVLIRNADLALYRAKEIKATSLNHCVFEPGMEHHDEARQSRRLELQQMAGRGLRPDVTPEVDPSLYNARITTALSPLHGPHATFLRSQK